MVHFENLVIMEEFDLNKDTIEADSLEIEVNDFFKKFLYY